MNSEADIESLLEPGVFEEKDGSSVVTDMERYPDIKFIGFKKDTAPAYLEMRGIPKFYLFQSGKAYVTNMDDYPSCREVVKSDNSHSILELAIDRFYLDRITPYEIGFAMAEQLGFDIKTCQFCKYWRSGYEYDFSTNFCCLYKKYGTPRNPEGTESMSCQYYIEDRKKMHDILDAVCATPIIVVKQ